MTGESLCSEELALLQKMVDSLQAIAGIGFERGNKGSWAYYHKNKSWFFEQNVTFAGTTMDITLDLDMGATQVNRIEQIFNDATARDIDIRIYANPAATTYISLYTQAADTSTTKVVQAGAEYKYTANTRLDVHYANFTAGKTVTVRIQVDEL